MAEKYAVSLTRSVGEEADFSKSVCEIKLGKRKLIRVVSDCLIAYLY